MISAYSIAAVFFMIVAIGAMYRNFTSRSPFYLDIFGKKYARESQVVTGVFEKLEWGVCGSCWLICRIEKNGIEVKLPHTCTIKEGFLNKEIQLVLFKDTGFDVYVLQCHRNENESFTDHVVMKSEEITQQNKKAQIIFAIAAVGCCIGFAYLQSIPVFSCILFLASTAVFMLSKPLLDWKKYEKCCKIYTKEAGRAKMPEVGLKQSGFPPDYNHWSQIQKDLYSIKVRLESEQIVGKGNTKLEDNIPPVEIEQLDVNQPSNSEESNVYEGSVFKVCENCGCIVDNDVFYCPNCGAPQKKVITFPKNCGKFEGLEKKQENGQDISFPKIKSEEITSSERLDDGIDNVVPKERTEKVQEANNLRCGKKSKNRRYRPHAKSSETDVDKMIQSLEPSSLSSLFKIQ